MLDEGDVQAGHGARLPHMTFAAIVFAGGRAVRLDGADKASVEYRGRTLLEHALDALVDAAEVVVVGDPVPTTRPVTFTRESPRYGGPVAALLTGRDALLRAPRTVGVLAVDMPRVTPWTFRRLHEAAARARRRVPHRRRRSPPARRGARRGAARRGPARPRGPARHAAAPAARRPRPGRRSPPDGDEGRDVDTWADLRDLSADDLIEAFGGLRTELGVGEIWAP